MAPLTSILKTIGLSDLPQRKLKTNKVVGGSGKADNRNPSKKLKNAKSGIQTHIKVTGEPTFFTPIAKEAFNQLRQAFTKAPIL